MTEKITFTKEWQIRHCPNCDTFLQDRKRNRFREDTAIDVVMHLGMEPCDSCVEFYMENGQPKSRYEQRPYVKDAGFSDGNGNTYRKVYDGAAKRAGWTKNGELLDEDFKPNLRAGKLRRGKGLNTNLLVSDEDE